MEKDIGQLSFFPERDIFEIGKEYADKTAARMARERSETESQEQAKKGRRKVPLETYRKFIRGAGEYNLDPDAIFVGTDMKRTLLADVMKYEKLVILGNKRILLRNASEVQIGRVFQNTYKTAINSQI